MPDLIIKPTATSGNKLILKDQAGGAVLTTADSGATIANATLASTTTFPAGHVIQTQNVTGTQSSNITTTSASFVTTGIQRAITPVKAGSSILLNFSSGSSHMNNSGGSITAYLSVAGGTSANVLPTDGGLCGIKTILTWINVHLGFVHIHNPTYTLGQELVYQIWHRSGSSGTLFYTYESANAGSTYWNFVVTEIAG